MAAVRAIAEEHEILDGWPAGGPDFLDLEREYGRLLVADDGAGVVAGFSGTLTRGALTHLGDLFITEHAQSGGHGGLLLDAILPPPGAVVVTFASADRRAQALYLRRGLIPGQPLWYLRGRPAGLARDVGPVLRPVGVGAVADLDAAVSGGDREQQLAWYAALPGVDAWMAEADAYVFTRCDDTTCRIGPAGGRDPDACARSVLSAVGDAAARGLDVKLLVPGAHPVVLALLRAGLRITDADLFMTSHPGAVPLDRYLPHSDLG
jgi:hypothetical protein